MSTARGDNRPIVYLASFLFCAGCGLVSMENTLVLGIVLIILSLPLFYIPCVFLTYDVNFVIATVKDTGVARMFRDVCLGGTTKNITIRTAVEPDSDKMMAYVYGPLAEDMNAIHSLNHLIHDDVSQILSPKSFSDLNRSSA